MRGWSPQVQSAFHGARTYSGTSDGRPCSFVYGTVALYGAWFHTLRLPHGLCNFRPSWRQLGTSALQPRDDNALAAYIARVWADPFSLATTQGVSVVFTFLGVLRCFTSPACPPPVLCVQTGDNAALPALGFPIRESTGQRLVERLTVAYRSRSRPSSTLGAKASTVCPYYLDGDLARSDVPRCLLTECGFGRRGPGDTRYSAAAYRWRLIVASVQSSRTVERR